MLVMALAFGILLTGCPQEPSETTYTVWTASTSYSEYSKKFPALTLTDGYYGRLEITKSELNSLPLSNYTKNKWTEDQIYDWFIGRGFPITLANQEKAWLITIDHGFLAIRDRNIVYMILK